jgi:hypothetical protein
MRTKQHADNMRRTFFIFHFRQEYSLGRGCTPPSNRTPMLPSFFYVFFIDWLDLGPPRPHTVYKATRPLHRMNGPAPNYSPRKDMYVPQWPVDYRRAHKLGYPELITGMETKVIEFRSPSSMPSQSLTNRRTPITSYSSIIVYAMRLCKYI